MKKISLTLAALSMCIFFSNAIVANASTNTQSSSINTKSSATISSASLGVGQAVIRGSNVNFRKNPGLNSSMYSFKLKDGCLVSILSSSAKYADGYYWYKVKYNGYTGYVASIYLEMSA